MANPVVLSSTSSTAPAGNIQAIVWEGAATAGDSVVLYHTNGAVFWRCRAHDTNNYKGIAFVAPVGTEGITVNTLSSGLVLLYYAK
jgi:hypothetical protein